MHAKRLSSSWKTLLMIAYVSLPHLWACFLKLLELVWPAAFSGYLYVMGPGSSKRWLWVIHRIVDGIGVDNHWCFNGCLHRPRWVVIWVSTSASYFGLEGFFRLSWLIGILCWETMLFGIGLRAILIVLCHYALCWCGWERLLITQWVMGEVLDALLDACLVVWQLASCMPMLGNKTHFRNPSMVKVISVW